MAQAAWPQVVKQACGTPDFDTVKQELTEAQTGIFEIKRQVLAVGASLKSARDAIGGVVDYVGGIGERLGAVERRVDDFAGTATELETGLHEVSVTLTAQGTLVQTVKQEVAVATTAVAAIQTGLASAQNALAAFDGRLHVIEDRLDDLSCKNAGLDQSVTALGTQTSAQAKLTKGLQAQVATHTAALAQAEAGLAAVETRVQAGERRWQALWCYLHALSLHMKGWPPTRWATLLRECGVKDLDVLAKQKPADLLGVLRAENAKSRHIEDDPEEADIAELVRVAQEILGRSP